MTKSERRKEVDIIQNELKPYGVSEDTKQWKPKFKLTKENW